MTPHFAYPLMVLLSVLLLPALVLMPATNTKTMLLIDLPLVHRHDGLARRVLRDGRARAGPAADRRAAAAPRAPRARRGARAAPDQGGVEGLHSMAGEFVRTPKKGTTEGRYRAAADLPLIEIAPGPRLGRQHGRVGRDRTLVRHALRDALHVRLRLRRLLRGLRAAHATEGAPRPRGGRFASGQRGGQSSGDPRSLGKDRRARGVTAVAIG